MYFTSLSFWHAEYDIFVTLCIYFQSGTFMVQLIKKGGLRERANRSPRYQGSENSITTLNPNRYKEQRISEQDKSKTQAPTDALK